MKLRGGFLVACLLAFAAPSQAADVYRVVITCNTESLSPDSFNNPTITQGGAVCINGTFSASVTPAAIVPVVSTADEASHVLKASAGSLFSLEFTNKGAGGYLILLNATSVPADGAITGVLSCAAVAPGSASSPASASITTPPGSALSATTGLVAVYSTTGCFTKTLGSAVGFFQAMLQ